MYRLNPDPQLLHSGTPEQAKHATTINIQWQGTNRTFNFSKISTAVFGCLTTLLIVGVLTAGSYLFLRDDLVSATLARHVKMQHAYEDRISALRSQVDIVTSRQLLDQQAVENRMSELIAKQKELSERDREVSKIFSRATGVKKPRIKPKMTLKTSKSPTKLRLGSLLGSSNPFLANSAGNVSAFAAAEINPEAFNSLEVSLEQTERAQLAELKQLKIIADRKAEKLASILSKQGIRVPLATGVGGPLIMLKGGNNFVNSVNALDASLETLEKVRRAAKSLPLGSPVPGKRISSHYGSRRDPFTGKRAVHGGLDFKAKSGNPVLATASGKVIKAGRNGGYGKMIELDHGGGITTRYAHLSKIRVKVGQRIARGKRIGNIGSTGRSTGPHLHYEVRRKGRVLNPIHYVRLEKHLRPYL